MSKFESKSNIATVLWKNEIETLMPFEELGKEFKKNGSIRNFSENQTGA
jgi:hypothetical protein